MPRIRSVHPGLWTDVAFVELSMPARLLAIGLWTESDDYGVFKWSPRQIKMRIFPADNVEIETLLSECIAQHIIIRLERDGIAYGVVRNFRKFQRPNRPSKPIIPIDEEIAAITGIPFDERPSGPTNGGAGRPHSVSHHGVLMENGEHGIVQEGEESETLDSDSDPDGKIAVGPWKRPAILPDDDAARLVAVHQVETFFADAPDDRNRILTHLGNRHLVPDPAAYAETCIANAIRGRQRRKPKPAVEPTTSEAPVPAVWVRFGSPAWNAWDGVNPLRALESKHHPGELGRYRQSEYPPERARA